MTEENGNDWGKAIPKLGFLLGISIAVVYTTSKVVEHYGTIYVETHPQIETVINAIGNIGKDPRESYKNYLIAFNSVAALAGSDVRPVSYEEYRRNYPLIEDIDWKEVLRYVRDSNPHDLPDDMLYSPPERVFSTDSDRDLIRMRGLLSNRPWEWKKEWEEQQRKARRYEEYRDSIERKKHRIKKD